MQKKSGQINILIPGHYFIAECALGAAEEL